jgi:predicted nucleic acid-binding protein
VTACVIDASVAAKWFLPASGETLTTEALGMLESYAEGRLRLLAPDLFWPEFGNILWKAARHVRRQLFLRIDDNYFSRSTTITF